MQEFAVPPGTNGLLQRLPEKIQASLAPHLRRSRFAQGTILHEAGESISNVYFPLSGMVSILAVLQGGEAIETSIVGREGFVGGFFGVRGWRSPGHAVMQTSGELFALNVRQFKKTYETSDQFRDLINAYQSVLYYQAQQSAACQALHQVEARMCRWLLQAQDALGGDTLHLTQEFLSHMLGVRRTSVSGSANKVQAEGLISYKRGIVRIIDRKGLENRACECHAAIRAAVADMLPKA